MRYHVHDTGADHVFYAATGATTSNEVLRVKGNGSGIMLPTTGGTATPLNYYEEYNHVTTFTGANNSPPLTLKITRIGRQVTVTCPGHWGAGTAATFFTMTTPFPARFRHSLTALAPQITPMIVAYNGAHTPGLVQINTDGTLNIYPFVANFNYTVTASDTGFRAWTVSWNI
jgi:hypothetical protein